MTGEMRNIIRFSFAGGKIRLLLENEFIITAGIEPNVNAFLCNFDDFALLGDNPGVEGSLEFWSTGSIDDDGTETGDPDFVFEQCAIVDCDVHEYGNASVNQGSPKVLVWRLMIADRRHNLVAPRGGVMTQGVLNKTPFHAGGTLDVNNRRVRTAQDLAKMCIDAMGLHDELTLSAALLSDSPRPNDIDWRGNHAPTELEKILVEAGFVLTIDAGGLYSIVKKNAGDQPKIPGDAVKLPMPGIDRRGATVVFSSYPNPIVNTVVLKGPADFRHPDPDKDELEYCFLDSDKGEWITLLEASTRLFKNKDPELIIYQGYDSGIDEQWVDLAVTSLFRCFRINPKNTKWGNRAILHDVFLKGDFVGKPFIKAIQPKFGSDGLYHNTNDKVRVPLVNLLDHGHVMVTWARLMKIEHDFAAPAKPPEGDVVIPRPLQDLDHNLTMLKPGDLELTVSLENTTPDSDGFQQVDYFLVGYRSELGKIVELSDKETQAALLQKDTIIVSRPELILHRTDGVDDNRKALTDQTSVMAPLYIRGSGSPTTQYHIRGFGAYTPTGIISKVTIKQSPPMTVVDLNTWFLPRGTYLHREKDVKGTNAMMGGGSGGGGGGESFPKQNKTAVDRMAVGQSGASLQSLPVSPFPPIVPSGKPHGVLRIDSPNNTVADNVALGGAQYIATLMTGVAAIDPYASFAKLTGMTEGTKVLAVNVIEPSVEQLDGDGNSTGGSHWIVCGNLANPSYANFEYIGTTDKGLGIVAINVPNPHDMFFVELTTDGGSNGDGSSKPTYTYTCKSLANDVIATKAIPRTRFADEVGPVTVTGLGIGYFDVERKFHLLDAFERPQTEVECDT